MLDEPLDDYEECALILCVYFCEDCATELYKDSADPGWYKQLANLAKEQGWYCKWENNDWTVYCSQCKSKHIQEN